MSAFAIELPGNQRSVCFSCGVEFASPVIAKRREDGGTFFCPNGHGQRYTKTEAARLREELERVKTSLEWERSQRQTARMSLIAQKAQTTKAKNKLKRVRCGVCPDCNRSFVNLRRHMVSKHKAEGKE